MEQTVDATRYGTQTYARIRNMGAERVVVVPLVRGTRQVSEIVVLSIDGCCGRLGN